jgi:hypothetical protein
MNRNRHLVLAGIIFFAIALRLLPHPWGFTPIGALALFGGAQYASKKIAFLLPMSVLMLSDVIIGFHVLIPFVYGCFLFNVCLGFWVRSNKKSHRIVLATGVNSILFYLVTNFSVWLYFDTYPQTVHGLIVCYVAGLPFLLNGLLGDLFYSGLLFGGMALAEHRFVSIRESKFRPFTA